MNAFPIQSGPLVRGLTLALILVAAASAVRLGNTRAGFRADKNDLMLASADGRLTLEADFAAETTVSAAGGPFSIQSEVELLEETILSAAGFEMASSADEAADTLTIIDVALFPGQHEGGVYGCDGDLLLTEDSSVWLGLGGPVETVAALGEVRLGGTLVLEWLGDVLPAEGDSFVIITGGAILGEFDFVDWRAWPGHLEPRLEVRANEVVVVIE